MEAERWMGKESAGGSGPVDGKDSYLETFIFYT
jgi:hypothetical protein